MERILGAWQEAGIPGYLSQSAGSYLCNFSFYCAAQATADQGLACRVGFLHLPLLPELVTDPEEQPSMARSLQEEGLDVVLDVTAAARDGPVSTSGGQHETQRSAGHRRRRPWRSSPRPAVHRPVPERRATAKPVSGGTATFAEPPGTSPNYIFPMITAAYYSVANIEQFQRLSFRSLYWIGNGQGQPVVDPARSLAALPVYSKNDSVVTIHLGNYKWSDGQPVTARDVGFWINLLKANKGSFAAYIPGEFPDNLKSYKIVDPKTIVLTLTGPYNPTWFTYDQLSQITPLPVQAWDKTSATGKVGNYDTTTAGAKAVFAS